VQTEAARPEAADLREYLGVIRRRKWSIILVTLVVVGAALAYAFRQTPQYTSESRVLITPTGPGATVTSINVANEQALAHSAAVASIVKTDLRSVRTVGSLLSGLHVAAEANTDILDFAYTSPAPPVSKVLAQGFADAYLKFRQQQANRQLSSQVAGLLAQINSTKSQLANVDSRLGAANNPAARSNLVAQRDSLIAQLGALQQQLESLKASVANQTGGQSVQDAALPVTPSSPNKVRDGALALFVGLALGVGVAFLRERLDDHLRGSEDLEAAMQACRTGRTTSSRS
jgi:uncharacterized protein involved in exopolysaccharide biosynthesis